MFYFEGFNKDNDFISLNIAFKTLGDHPLHIEFTNSSKSDIVKKLFGDKTHSWLISIFGILDRMKLNSIRPIRKNELLSKKLKILTVLLNLLIKRSMLYYPDETRTFIYKLLGHVDGTFTSATSSSLFGKDDICNAVLKSRDPELNFSKWNSATLFQNDLLDPGNFKNDDSEIHLLNVFLPLILAIWQVFELRVNQWVGHQLLAKSLLVKNIFYF